MEPCSPEAGFLELFPTGRESMELDGLVPDFLSFSEDQMRDIAAESESAGSADAETLLAQASACTGEPSSSSALLVKPETSPSGRTGPSFRVIPTAAVTGSVGTVTDASPGAALMPLGADLASTHAAPKAVRPQPKAGNSSAQQAAAAKRRRRIRNAKQQELNRLAQQRYRERKKQKYCDLQGTVDELSVRLEQLRVLREEKQGLEDRNEQLEKLVSSQAVELAATKGMIGQQQQQLAATEAQIAEQARSLQQQVGRIGSLEGRLAAAEAAAAAAAAAAVGGAPAAAGGSAAAPASDSTQPSSAATLAHALNAVFTRLWLPTKDTAAGPELKLANVPDSVMQQFSSCCNEVLMHLHDNPLPQQAPHAIQVTCC